MGARPRVAFGGSLLLGVIVAAPASALDPMHLGELLRRFADMPGLSTRFREERHLTLLQAPIRSEGTLYFSPPDRLARHVERPAPATLIFDGAQITVREAGEIHSLDLSTMPTLLAFVDGLRLLFRGDLEALRGLFALDFEATDAKRTWRLRMTPRGEDLQAMISSIEVQGHEGTLQAMRIIERGGNETRLYFSEVDATRRFDEDEIERLFRASHP